MFKHNTGDQTGDMERQRHEGRYTAVGRTPLSVPGGDAVGMTVLLQAQLLLVQVHRRGVYPRALQVQPDPLTPKPPEHRPAQMKDKSRCLQVAITHNESSTAHEQSVMLMLLELTAV